MQPRLARPDIASRPLYLCDPAGLDAVAGRLSATEKKWIASTGFSAKSGELCLLPDQDGGCSGALFGLAQSQARPRSRFDVARAVPRLPAGTVWHIETELSGDAAEEVALAWLLSGYSFKRYTGQSNESVPAQLVPPEGVDVDRVEAIAAGEFLTRDLINTPPNDMGPAELEAAARKLAGDFSASINVIEGDALLEANFPLIHAVGRASVRAPRLIDMRWGSTGPRLTLVGKGVCFDTGGLNLKPGSSMGLMKKDMGGSATVLGLTRMIMSLGLPIQLRVLIPAVENSVAGASFRPQDILTSRRGLTVEINNTDAEGRLVLADALCLADEEQPDLMVSMATLTGAARVALGPDLAPFYCDDDATSTALADAARVVADPVWQMPFHNPYEAMIEPGVADLDNAPSGGFAGSITAALFLRRFVENADRYIHFDIYGWQPSDAPGRPKGGVGQGARALLQALPAILDLPG